MKTCPNCCHARGGTIEESHEPFCILGALLTCCADRGMTDYALERTLESCDVNALWDDLGPVIDKLHNGTYSGIEWNDETNLEHRGQG